MIWEFLRKEDWGIGELGKIGKGKEPKEKQPTWIAWSCLTLDSEN
jgi:hypothetical protein